MSDHFSSHRALSDPALDLTDLFVFPSPTEPGHLVLAMDVYPSAPTEAVFSDGVDYRFRIRPVSITSTDSGPRFDVAADEYAITCTFDAPQSPKGGGPSTQMGTCKLPNGHAVAVRVNDDLGSCGEGVRIFVGLRSDPNFLDEPGYVETLATRRMAFRPTGVNLTEGLNVLSIVVELDVGTVLGSVPGTLLGVAAETVIGGKYPVRIERFGRAEIKNVYLSEIGADGVNRDIDLRDLYNQEDPFQLSEAYLTAYRSRLNANFQLFDSFDGKIDWPLQADGGHPLTELTLADFQVVDVSKPFAEDSYLEIERAALEGREHTTCGGRAPNDDAVDTMASLVITRGEPRVSDGVDQATVRAPLTFPYLAPPNPHPPHGEHDAVFPAKVSDQLALVEEPASRH